MKILKVFYFFNLLLVINLLESCLSKVHTSNSSKNDELQKIDHILQGREKKKKIILISCLVTGLALAIASGVGISLYIKKKKGKEQREIEEEKRDEHPEYQEDEHWVKPKKPRESDLPKKKDDLSKYKHLNEFYIFLHEIQDENIEKLNKSSLFVKENMITREFAELTVEREAKQRGLILSEADKEKAISSFRKVMYLTYRDYIKSHMR
ncbi:early transcribed membrane protein [Plasmodium gallinaceum]|uniref:Early transcribed membrane protein n=1 Tax=Plasmodium gallinaceum TaxID=5849 RepID=A0A1J1GQ67_PLAGA|nr:early transcribed membrane protein [Plasmodium gallinaceum]CRG94414.1 early transcribed membrane protein [Plasmodium gallinaceum]